MNPPPPPPPPPHGSSSRANPSNGPGGLPPGNYDIFVIPPHSSGSGFLYLPSLQVQRNSFLAGVVCTLAAVSIWVIVVPVMRQWTSTIMSSGGSGVILIMLGIGVLGWAFGKTQSEMNSGGSSSRNQHGPSTGSTPGQEQAYAQGASSAGTQFPGGTGYQQPNWQQQHQQQSSSQANWEKAREEMRKREDDRKRKEEAERKAEKERWERSRQREREAREKEAREKESRTKEQKEKELREKVFQDRLKKEKDAREAREKAAKESKDKAEREKTKSATGNYQKPTAQSYAASEDAYSFRPYDKPRSSPTKMDSSSSYVSGSATSYTGTQSTAQTSPTPSQYGAWSNEDPNKVTIRAVFLFSDSFQKPVAQLVVGQGKITQGLVLKLESEGMFIDDDVRKVPQREWDVKAWTLKLLEVSFPLTPCETLISKLTSRETGDLRGLHILRASVRDAENKKYVFLIQDSEAWKVATGLQRLKRGSQTRSLGTSGLSVNEMTNILRQCGM